MDKYRYLFPYEKVPLHSRVLIYGAGILGQEYLKQMLITGYCRVVGFIDKNYDKYTDTIVPVMKPEQIVAIKFDYIVLALRTENWIPEIKRILANLDVAEEKIVYALERKPFRLPRIETRSVGIEISKQYAYEFKGISFALLLSGGIGDMVNHKRFVMELMRLVPRAKIDIYVIQDATFPQWLYSDCNSVQNVMLDLGAKYSSNIGKYDLSISIYGSAFMTVDYFCTENFGEKYREFIEKIKLLQRKTRADGMSLAMPAAVAFLRRIYQGIDCYSWMNYGDVFDIHDYRISIPYQKEYSDEFENLGLENYITVNIGNGSCQDGRKIAKTWPFDRFRRTVELFRTAYPDIKVVQVGASNNEVLPNADMCLMGRAFGLLAYVLRGSRFHLDIEGGLVHWASQIGTKCIVLFGPTSELYNSYPNNINIKRGTCHDCYGLYDEVTCCARHMEEPECMYSITPEIVMKEIDEYMRN